MEDLAKNNVVAQLFVNIANKVCNANAMSKSRCRNNVYARIFIAVEMRKTDSFLNIAKFFNLDVAVPQYYIKKHNDAICYDKKYKMLHATFINELVNSYNKDEYFKQTFIDRIINLNKELKKMGFCNDKIYFFWQECIQQVKQAN